MGQEARCTARWGDLESEGTARLETGFVVFRGDFRLKIPLKDVRSAEAAGGWLTLTWPEGPASFEIGAAAPRWAGRILNPPSRLEKLGLTPGIRVAVLGVADEDFLEEVRSITADVALSRPKPASDAIFLAASSRRDLGRLRTLQRSLKDAGALWVVRPKGKREVAEADVLAAGRDAGLVDVKVVAFSPTHTAEKFVLPVARRGAARSGPTRPPPPRRF